MFYSPAVAVADTTPTGAVLPTFDELLVGPAVVAGDDAEDSPAATAFVWRTRAWLPPTKHQRG